MPRLSVRADGRRSPRLDLRLELRNPARAPIKRTLVGRLVRHVLRDAGLAGSLRLAVHLVDDASLQQANRAQRGLDAPTDVLSFPLSSALQQVEATFALPPDEPRHLGDILISTERARAQAAEYGHSVEREICYLLAHGVLHLLGHDHVELAERQEMRRREEAALAPLGLTR